MGRDWELKVRWFDRKIRDGEGGEGGMYAAAIGGESRGGKRGKWQKDAECTGEGEEARWGRHIEVTVEEMEGFSKEGS